jgi:hypothetical protein
MPLIVGVNTTAECPRTDCNIYREKKKNLCINHLPTRIRAFVGHRHCAALLCINCTIRPKIPRYNTESGPPRSSSPHMTVHCYSWAAFLSLKVLWFYRLKYYIKKPNIIRQKHVYILLSHCIYVFHNSQINCNYFLQHHETVKQHNGNCVYCEVRTGLCVLIRRTSQL